MRPKRSPATRGGAELRHLAAHRLSTGFAGPIATPACLAASRLPLGKDRSHSAPARYAATVRVEQAVGLLVKTLGYGRTLVCKNGGGFRSLSENRIV
jgi:hypothetical protein